MLAQMKIEPALRLEGKRTKELMSSSSLSGMSQMSNSSEEALEPFIRETSHNNKSDTSERCFCPLL